MEKHGIAYDAVAVNEEYLRDGDGNVSLERYLEKHKCSLIVAFKGYREEMLDKLNKENIEKVYAYDFQGRIAVEGIDSKITDEMLEEHASEMQMFRAKLADKESESALDEYIHQKMYGEYTKNYSDKVQYFDEDIMTFGKEECMVDCGGFDGADTKHFFELTGDDAKSYIFEPDEANCEKIRKNFYDDSRVQIFNFATGDENTQMHFQAGNGTSSKIAEYGDEVINVRRLDDVIDGSNVTFLKMDVEGFELKSLYGAEKLIRKYRPKMAICIYHRAEDLWTIPQYILSLHNDYKFYVRSYHHAGIETVLYAL